MFSYISNNVKIIGIASAVPSTLININEEKKEFGKEKIERLAKSSGLQYKHISNKNICTSDLCYSAAKKLLNELNWKKTSIDFLVFVTQTPDYVLPATACVLQQRLGLSSKTVAFDINLGCSGFVYGLWVISNFLSNNQKSRGLLLVGDTISKIASPEDISVKPLFGDAGTAVAINYKKKLKNFSCFYFGTDGSGYKYLIYNSTGIND